MYLYTENHITNSEFIVYEKTPVYLGDYVINTKVYIDENFGIRKVSYDESENGKFLLTIYYDSDQVIRFAYAYLEKYATSDYEEDIKSEYRIYYDNSGKLLWKAQSEDGNYIALGEKVDIKFFEHILNECPYEIFHQLNNSN